MSLSTATLAFILSLGFEFGGEKIVDVTYTDGSNSTIEAGKGLTLNGGIIYQPNREGLLSNLEFQGTLGVKWTETKKAENGSISWSHIPVDALVFWRPEDRAFRLGAGLAAHFANELKGTGVASPVKVTVDNAMGFSLAGDYFFGPEKNVSIGGRYTNMQYKANGVAVDGSSYGIILAMQWPQGTSSKPSVTAKSSSLQ